MRRLAWYAMAITAAVARLTSLPIQAQTPCSAPGVLGTSRPTVSAMVGYDDGTGMALHVGGAFASAGAAAASNVARWNGIQWQPVGTGLSGPIEALAAHTDGTTTRLYACGSFPAGNGTIGTIAAWNGSTWAQVGPGFQVGAGVGGFSLLDVDEDGAGPLLPALYAGGDFVTDRVLRWNGTAWLPIGTGAAPPSGTRVRALAVFTDSLGRALYAGGDDISLHAAIWRLDLTTFVWTQVSAGLPSSISAVLSLATHDPDGAAAGCSTRLYAAMTYQPGANNVYRLTATATSWTLEPNAWTPPQPSNETHVLAELPGAAGAELYVGGSTGTTPQTLNTALASKVTGQSQCNLTWAPVGQPLLPSNSVNAAYVLCFASMDLGLGAGPEIYAGGEFVTAGAVAPNGPTVNNVVRLQSGSWQALPDAVGLGVGQANSSIGSMTINGVGAPGIAGPFCMSLAPGASQFIWSGPPNAQVFVMAGPRSPLNPSLGCFGILDIGTPPLFLDLQLLTSFTLDASGQLILTRPLPPLPSGPIGNFQSGIVQPSSVCPLVPTPIVLTAAFYLSMV